MADVGERIETPRFVDSDLYELSRILAERRPDEQSHGLLGGEWGYGNEFENDVFEMHPYWWGDCECGHAEAEAEWDVANRHADECYQAELERRGGWDYKSGVAERLASEWGLPAHGCAAHCTCDYKARWQAWLDEHAHDDRCPIVLPNFRHKPSGIEVTWYKYIGRGSYLNREVSFDEWRTLIDECIRSLHSPRREDAPRGRGDGEDA